MQRPFHHSTAPAALLFSTLKLEHGHHMVLICTGAIPSAEQQHPGIRGPGRRGLPVGGEDWQVPAPAQVRACHILPGLSPGGPAAGSGVWAQGQSLLGLIVMFASSVATCLCSCMVSASAGASLILCMVCMVC